MTKRILLPLGLVFIGFCAFAALRGALTLHAAMPVFERSNEANWAGPSDSIGPIDFSLWSPARIHAYKESLSRQSNPPLAVLRIPKLRIVAPVLNGTDDITLNRGVGLISGTALPGQPGNIGIAGHRDSFFRGLKDIARGDRIELDTAGQIYVYVVDKAYITKPQDVNVLRAGPTPAITLVTCYPFYYAGSAPQRYVVQAFKQAARSAGAL